MKILIIRCTNFESLLDFEGDVSHGNGWHNQLSRPDHSGKYHASWEYLWNLNAFFRRSDCILIETRPRANPFTKVWRRAACRTLFSVARSTKSLTLLRYLVVGNDIDGYAGLECCPRFTWRDEIGNEIYSYFYLNEESCKKILRGRCLDI